MEEIDKQKELFMTAWRASDFYVWITEMLKEEVNSSYVKEQVVARAQAGEPMSNDEIGEAMRVEVQASLRIQSILDKLE